MSNKSAARRTFRSLASGFESLENRRCPAASAFASPANLSDLHGSDRGSHVPPPAEVFKKFDTNQDHSLSHDEFVNGLKAALKNAQIDYEKVWNFTDANHDGSVNLDELRAAMEQAQQQGHNAPDALTRGRLFQQWDTNHDGSLSKDEFKAGVAGFKNYDGKADDLFNKLDQNHDQMITTNELQERQTNNDDRLSCLFKKADTDSSGGISLDEFKAAVKDKISSDRVEQIYNQIDSNHDQSISRTEFGVAILTTKRDFSHSLDEVFKAWGAGTGAGK